VPITPLFAAIFALMLVLLSLNVVRQRFSKRVVLGSGDDRDLEIAIRIQANFIEYVPLTLIIFWFIEQFTFGSSLVMLLGTILLVARIAHVVGMLNPKKYLIFRQIGILASHAVLVIGAVRLIWHYLPY